MGARKEWSIAKGGRSPHQATMMQRELSCAMHGQAIIPHDQIVWTPPVPVNEPLLRGELTYLNNQCSTFVLGQFRNSCG